MGTQQGKLHPAGLSILFCWPTQEPCVSTASTGENEGGWTGRVETSKKEIPSSERSMYGYTLTYSRL